MRPVRSVGLLCALALTMGVAAVVVPGVASADLVGQTITADLNNDGLPDHATLGQIGTTSTCTVTVALGTAPATFGTPKVHQYTSLETTAPLCPNVGAAVKLGTDKRPDLVTGFSFGFQDLMVLHKYQPTAIYHGLTQPDFIRSADVDGDGHADIIEGSDQLTSIEVLHSNADGTIGTATVGACASHPQYVLGDFNGDHGQDILLSDICPPDRTSVRAEVLFGNGAPAVTLASSTDPSTKYVVFSIDLNYDGIPDAGVVQIAGGVTTVLYFLNNGAGVFTPIPSPR
jgi:hypothetical protein